jgi:hypothetical protein
MKTLNKQRQVRGRSENPIVCVFRSGSGVNGPFFNSHFLNYIAEGGAPGGIEPPTFCLEGAPYKNLSAASGVAYEGTRHLSRS